MTKHIILDTDAGGDPDDLFAILFALNSPEIKLELIVTNDEHKGDRARFIKQFLSLADKNIAIGSGIDLGNKELFVVGSLLNKFDTGISVNFLDSARAVVERNKLTYYVCIGPQSNLAKFIEKYPHLKNKVRTVMMGGAINNAFGNKAEHNIRYDIPAAQFVFNSDWKKQYVLSDITINNKIKIDTNSVFLEQLKKSKQKHISLLVDSIYCFFNKLFPATYMHDPLALSYLINKRIITFKKKKLCMDNKGIISIDNGGKDTAISSSANYDLFWKVFAKRIV